MQWSAKQNRGRVNKIVTETLTMIQANKNIYILSTYYVPCIVPGVKDTRLSPGLWGVHGLVGNITSSQLPYSVSRDVSEAFSLHGSPWGCQERHAGCGGPYSKREERKKGLNLQQMTWFGLWRISSSILKGALENIPDWSKEYEQEVGKSTWESTIDWV